MLPQHGGEGIKVDKVMENAHRQPCPKFRSTALHVRSPDTLSTFLSTVQKGFTGKSALWAKGTPPGRPPPPQVCTCLSECMCRWINHRQVPRSQCACYRQRLASVCAGIYACADRKADSSHCHACICTVKIRSRFLHRHICACIDIGTDRQKHEYIQKTT